MKRAEIIEIIDRTLDAYSREHILRYFSEVKEQGITEHGFPRLTANIGILIAHGRRTDLIPLFTEMMDFCCDFFTKGIKAANDFSVKEIVFCLLELERAGSFPKEKTEAWRADLARIDNRRCYTQYAHTPDDIIYNWACFSGVSEQLRKHAGIASDDEFIDNQMGSQLQFFDSNGMYRDPHDPMVYDLVTRGLYSVALHFGYNGKYAAKMDSLLRTAGLMTLKMQSVTGEVPYGGRSAQFIHNEAHIALICEYEASRYQREGNTDLASHFKYAADLAYRNMKLWLSEPIIRHVKNRYPLESGFGCEPYAYFDKYMITAASFAYVAYCFADDSVAPVAPPPTPAVTLTGEHFHKIFLAAGDYFAELDTNADPHYDASGLGRLHRAGAPSAICMSVPCTDTPNYKISDPSAIPMAIAHAVYGKGRWHFATSPAGTTDYRALSHGATDTSASVKIATRVALDRTVFGEYTLTQDGLSVDLSGVGRIGLMLPAFDFDGSESTVITATESSLTVTYRGWVCEYTTDGSIADTGSVGENRNGRYRAFVASSDNHLSVRIRIYEKA